MVVTCLPLRVRSKKNALASKKSISHLAGQVERQFDIWCQSRGFPCVLEESNCVFWAFPITSGLLVVIKPINMAQLELSPQNWHSFNAQRRGFSVLCFLCDVQRVSGVILAPLHSGVVSHLLQPAASPEGDV